MLRALRCGLLLLCLHAFNLGVRLLQLAAHLLQLLIQRARLLDLRLQLRAIRGVLRALRCGLLLLCLRAFNLGVRLLQLAAQLLQLLILGLHFLPHALRPLLPRLCILLRFRGLLPCFFHRLAICCRAIPLRRRGASRCGCAHCGMRLFRSFGAIVYSIHLRIRRIRWRRCMPFLRTCRCDLLRWRCRCCCARK